MDLSTTYMGLELKNPLIPGASPLSHEIAGIKALEDAGAAAVVVYSLFEEQIQFDAAQLDHFLVSGTESFAEAQSYFPTQDDYVLGPDEYLKHIQQAKEAVDIPVIGSLNGVSIGGWIDYARQIQEAGADALELNVYYLPANPDLTGDNVERIYTMVLEAVKETVEIPVAMKLSPFFSAPANMARQLDEAGADALVLFNRFYQPEIDIEQLEVAPKLVLSDPHEKRLPMRWIAMLFGKIKADMAATSGVHTAEDALQMLMAGAKATQLVSTLLANGPGRLTEILNDMTAWLEAHEYESVQQLIGSMSHRSCPEPGAFERANYMKVLQSYK